MTSAAWTSALFRFIPLALRGRKGISLRAGRRLFRRERVTEHALHEARAEEHPVQRVHAGSEWTFLGQYPIARARWRWRPGLPVFARSCALTRVEALHQTLECPRIHDNPGQHRQARPGSGMAGAQTLGLLLHLPRTSTTHYHQTLLRCGCLIRAPGAPSPDTIWPGETATARPAAVQIFRRPHAPRPSPPCEWRGGRQAQR